jgi:predicted glutamine amidotransferase
MCRMLGVISRHCETAEVYRRFRELARGGEVKPGRDSGHGDGWGVAGYLGRWPVYFDRSPGNVMDEEDRYLTAVVKLMVSKSRFSMVHLRKASAGAVSLANTHPFMAGDWFFAHNGTVLDAGELPLQQHVPAGTTDSERVFLWLREQVGDAESAFPARLGETLAHLRRATRHTSLTMMLCTPEYFSVFREYSTDTAEPGDDPAWNEDYYTLYSARDTEGNTLLCSEPMDLGYDMSGRVHRYRWTPLRNGEMVVLDRDAATVYRGIIGGEHSSAAETTQQERT